MTDFTKEYIRSVRMCSYLIEPPASEVIEHLCDEIEHLQQRIAELEHYKKLNEQWVKEKIDGLTTLEEIEKIVMIADRINKSNASIRCGWCDAEFETRDEVKEHAYGCKDNPLAQRIAELEQERQWIPVSERLPEEGQPALIDFGNNEITVGFWFWENEPEEWAPGTDCVGWQHWNYGSDKFFPFDEPPLHWLPLPQPPKEGE